MTTIVIDANILISAILNPFGIIPKIIITGSNKSEFVLPAFALEEIKIHKKKFCKHIGISITEFDMILEQLLNYLLVLSSDEIRSQSISAAENLTANIDVKDSIYVALTIELGALLWTGDKKLYNGLRKKKFNAVISTQELKQTLKGLF